MTDTQSKARSFEEWHERNEAKPSGIKLLLKWNANGDAMPIEVELNGAHTFGREALATSSFGSYPTRSRSCWSCWSCDGEIRCKVALRLSTAVVCRGGGQGIRETYRQPTKRGRTALALGILPAAGSLVLRVWLGSCGGPRSRSRSRESLSCCCCCCPARSRSLSRSRSRSRSRSSRGLPRAANLAAPSRRVLSVMSVLVVRSRSLSRSLSRSRSRWDSRSGPPFRSRSGPLVRR